LATSLKGNFQRSEHQGEPSLTGSMKKLLFLIISILFLLDSAFGQSKESNEGLQIPQMQPKKWALCIGASNYQSLGKLKFAAKDSIAFAKTLKTELDFPEDSVFVLADTDGYQAPTATNVKAKLDEILSRSSLDSGDLFIIYFSGHGMGLSDGDYWMPNDATPANAAEKGISITEVLDRLTKKKLRNVVIISDACRAGDKNPFGRSLISQSKKTNIGVLLGCAPGQKSYESPNFGQGLFNYFLNRAIKNKTAVDKAQGSMLLSKLGSIVGKNVEDFSRHDYGDDAQKPSIYAEKEQEVVLKSVPPEDGNLAGLLALYQKDAKDGVLSPQQVKDAMSGLAKFYFDSEKDEEALKILRTLQSFGDLDPIPLYIYVLISNRHGSSYELNSLLQKNNIDIPGTVWDDLAVIHGSVQSVGRPRFIKAIWTLYESEYREGLASSFFSMLQQANARKEQEVLADRLIKDFPASPVIQSYAQIIKASLQPAAGSDIDTAYQKFSSLAGSQSFLEPSLRILYNAHFVRREYVNAQRYVEMAIKAVPDSAYWQIRSMVVSSIIGDSDISDRAKRILSTTKDGRSVMSMITILGGKSLELEADFQSAAQRLKGNLQAETASWIVNSANHIETFTTMPDSLEKLAKGRGPVYSIGYRELSDLMTRLSGTEHFKAREFEHARRLMADDMSSHFDLIGEDPEQVITLASLLNGTNESYRLAILSLAGPWAPLGDRLVTDRAEFLQESFICLINNGMTVSSDGIYDRLAKIGGVNETVVARRSIGALLIKNLERAETSIQLLESMNPQGIAKSLLSLQKVHLELLKGDKEAINRFIGGIKPDLIVDEGVLLYIEYLRYLASGTDIPSERFLKMIIDPQPRYHDLWSASVKAITIRNFGKQSKDSQAIIDNLPAWAVAEPLNSSFQNFGFNQKEDFTFYVGHYEFDGYLTINQSDFKGTFIFNVDGSGNLNGTIGITGESDELKVSGKLNGFGRGALDVNIGGKPAYSSFAIIPYARYVSATKENLAQMLLILDSVLPFRMAFVITGPHKK
jgi:hypothetical protein